MKVFLVLLVILLFQIQCLAETIQISAPDISNEEFNAYYETHKEVGPTFVDFYLQQNPTTEHVRNLNSLYEKAMGYYFAKTRSQAMNYFSQIVELSLSEDWKANQRQMIFNSYLRLAELIPIKSNEFLKKAVAFDINLEPDQNFSKKIRDDFSDMKEVMKKNVYVLSLSDFKKFNRMLLNGREINFSTSELNILPGQYRVTFISNKFKPSTFIFSSQQLMLLNSPAIPFVEGSCDNESSDYFQNLEIKIYNPKCKKELNLMPELKNNSNFTPVDSKPLYEKPWFLIAAGTVAAFFIVKSLSTPKSGPTSETIQ